MELTKYEVPITGKFEPVVEVSATCSRCGRRFSSEVYESYLADERVCALLGMAKVTVTLPARIGGTVDKVSGSFLLCGDCLEKMLSELGLTLEDILPSSWVSLTDVVA